MTDSLHDLTTPWGLIQEAQRPDAPLELRRHCLEALAARYREPVFRYLVYCRVSDPNDRDDLTQAFFLDFLEKNRLDRLNAAKGRFRNYLAVAVANFAKNAWKGANRLGGANPLLRHHRTQAGDAVLDQLPTPNDESAEQYFEREYARNLLEEAVSAFQEECRARGLPHYLAVFERHVLHPAKFNHPSHAETAAALGCSTTDVNNHLPRSKKLFAKVLRGLVRQTVGSDEEVDDELRALEPYFP